MFFCIPQNRLPFPLRRQPRSVAWGDSGYSNIASCSTLTPPSVLSSMTQP
jgi:hypothetical protein